MQIHVLDFKESYFLFTIYYFKVYIDNNKSMQNDIKHKCIFNISGSNLLNSLIAAWRLHEKKNLQK